MSLEPEYVKQKEFSIKVKNIMQSLKKQPLAFVRTYGCQQNFADSEKIRGMLMEMGYGFTKSMEDANVIVFNTCAVRENAEERVFGNVGALKKLKEKNPELLIIVCGCMVQQEKSALLLRKKFPFINLIFGTHVMHTLPELIFNALSEKKRQLVITEYDEEIAEGLPVVRDSKTKASVSVMYGCNNFCTYCIVPYVRGRERSRRAEEIVNEVQELIKDGCRDILLLGQNVNSYGKGTSVNFAALLKKLNALDGDFKISYMTSHPKDTGKELIDTISECGKVSRHLHLPAQSGSNRILRLMNRGYTVENYLDTVRYARMKIPDVSITTDIIVGFPGETYDDFKETLKLMHEVEFDSAYTFLYSKRIGTAAAEMSDDAADAEEKGKWFRELLDVQGEIGRKTYERFIGKQVRVLCEGRGRTDDSLFTGKSSEGIIVDFEGNEKMIGKFVKIEIKKSLAWALIGEAVL